MRTKRLVVGFISACTLVTGVVATGTARADETNTRTVTAKIQNSSTGLVVATCITVERPGGSPMPGGNVKCIGSLTVARSDSVTFNIPADEAGIIRFKASVGGVDTTDFRPAPIEFLAGEDVNGCIKLVGSLLIGDFSPFFRADPPKFVSC